MGGAALGVLEMVLVARRDAVAAVVGALDAYHLVGAVGAVQLQLLVLAHHPIEHVSCKKKKHIYLTTFFPYTFNFLTPTYSRFRCHFGFAFRPEWPCTLAH